MLGANTEALAVSGNGGVVIGFGPGPFRWTRASGPATLNRPAGTLQCVASAISIDGTVAVGSCDNFPVKWSGTTPTVLGFAGGNGSAAVTAANLDGSILTGVNNGHTGVWINGTPTLLADPPGTTSSDGIGISSDGTVIVGNLLLSSDATGLGQAYRAMNGTTTLVPFIPGTPAFSRALGVSADGNKVVFLSKGFGSAVWTANTNTLTNLGSSFTAFAISGDGNTVVGDGPVGSAFGPTVVNVASGTAVLLSTILANLGVNLGDFSITDIVGVSTNGKVLVGTGTSNASGVRQGWVLVQP